VLRKLRKPGLKGIEYGPNRSTAIKYHLSKENTSAITREKMWTQNVRDKGAHCTRKTVPDNHVCLLLNFNIIVVLKFLHAKLQILHPLLCHPLMASASCELGHVNSSINNYFTIQVPASSRVSVVFA